MGDEKMDMRQHTVNGPNSNVNELAAESVSFLDLFTGPPSTQQNVDVAKESLVSAARTEEEKEMETPPKTKNKSKAKTKKKKKARLTRSVTKTKSSTPRKKTAKKGKAVQCHSVKHRIRSYESKMSRISALRVKKPNRKKKRRKATKEKEEQKEKEKETDLASLELLCSMTGVPTRRRSQRLDGSPKQLSKSECIEVPSEKDVCESPDDRDSPSSQRTNTPQTQMPSLETTQRKTNDFYINLSTKSLKPLLVNE